MDESTDILAVIRPPITHNLPEFVIPPLEKTIRYTPLRTGELRTPDIILDDMLHERDKFIKNATPLLEQRDHEETEIEAFLDGVLGPLRLPKKVFASLREGSEQIGVDMAEECARVSQAMAHHILYAGDPSAPKEFVDLMHQSVKMMEAISATTFGRESTAFKVIWRGITSQIAVMKMLTQAGYTVIQPDYRATDEVLDDPRSPRNEIFHIDVNGKIDIVAHKPGSDKCIGIDVKGRRFEDTETGPKIPRQQINVVENTIYDSQSLTDLQAKCKIPTQIRGVLVYVPTHEDLIDYSIDSSDDPKKVLRDFARPKKSWLTNNLLSGLAKIMEGDVTNESK